MIRTCKRLAALAAAVLLCLGLCACGGGSEAGAPDFYAVFGCTVIPSSEAQAAMQTYLEDLAGDLNGDGETCVSVEYIGISNDSNSVTDSGRLTVLLSEPQYTLFLLSDEPNEDFPGISANFCSQDYFEDLSAYGITPDADQSQRVTVSDCAILTEMGLGGIDFYAHVIDRDSEADMDAALAVIGDMLQ